LAPLNRINTKHTKMSIKRTIITAIVGLTLVAMVAPVTASAVTIEELLAQIQTLTAQLNALQAAQGGTPVPTGNVACAGITFDRNIRVGMTGSDIKCLQVLLNNNGFTLAQTGAGSPGAETSYFGPRTLAATRAFQVSRGWTPANQAGPLTRAALTALIGTVPGTPGTPIIPTGAGLTVQLATTNPASGTIVDGQAQFPLARLTFTNGDNAEVTVTGLKLKRIGVSADASLTNVYLFNGATRLTDGAAVSSSMINFNDATGLFKVPSRGSVTITVTADVDGTAGESVGIQAVTATDVITNASSVNGIFPITGNLSSIATGTLGSVSFNTTTTPAAASIDPQDEYTVWQNITTIGTRAVDMTRISFRKTGSVTNTDLQNFKLYVDGIQVGSTIQLDSNGYVTFDLSSSPKRLEAGTRTIKVLADIIGGSSLNFTMNLWSAADATFVDSQYNANILVQQNSTTFSKRSTGAQAVNSGTITITKMTDSPSGNIVDGGTNVTLAKYEVKAAGEPVKIETLYVSAVVSTSAVSYLRNGALYANGVQIGSTSNLYDNGYTTAYTTFNLGSSLIVNPGSPVTLEVRADIYDSDGTNDVTSGTTIAARIEGSSSWDNGLGMTSASSIDAPGADVDGNTLTVAQGGLTLSNYLAYTDQSVVAPLTNYPIAYFTLAASTTEDVNVTAINVALNAVASSYSSNLYVKYGTQTTNTKASAGATNSWSINYNLPAGTTVDVIVYANISSSATAGTAIATVDIDGTTVGSAVTADSTAVAGQNIAFTSGSFSTAFASSPLDQIVAGNQTVDAGTFDFTSSYQRYTITELRFTANSNAAAIASASIKDGTTVLKTVSYDSTNTYFNFTGLNVNVDASSTKTLTLAYTLSPSPSYSTSTSDVDTKAALTYVKYQDPNGSVSTDTNTRTGNSTIVYKSIPTLSQTMLTDTLSNGAEQNLYKFTVAAPSQGAIAIKQFKIGITWSDGGTDDVLAIGNLKLLQGGTDVTSSVTIQSEDGYSAEGSGGVSEGDGTIVVTWDGSTEASVLAGGSTTFTLKGTPAGFRVLGATDTAQDSIALAFTADSAAQTATYNYINVGTSTTGIMKLYSSASANGSAANETLIWSDKSSVAHSASRTAGTGDWSNSYLVKDVLTSQTFSR